MSASALTSASKQVEQPQEETGRGPQTAPRRRGLGSGFGALMIVPVLFMSTVALVPMGLLVYTALAGRGDSNLASVLTDPLFMPALIRTLVMAAVVTVLCVVIGVVISLGLLVVSRPVRAIVFAALVATFVISLMVRTYGWIIILQPKGLIYKALHAVGIDSPPLEVLQTPFAMYVGMVHVMLPFAVLMTYNAMSALNPSQLKAARSMGASGWYTFFRIVLPQSMPGVVAGAMLVFMISLGFYITPAMLGGPSELTIGTLIGRQMSVDFDFKAAAIIGLVLVAAVIILYALAERLFKVSQQWERS
jgi:putative spermidine/putrescine transport system permease protein